MIYFFSGLPGSGKSLHAAKMIDTYHMKGKNVITNFEVNPCFWDDKKARFNNPISKGFTFLKNLIRKKPKKVTYLNIDTGLIEKRTAILEEVSNISLSVDYLVNFAKRYHKVNDRGQILEKQTLLVIDECQVLFNSRSWNQKGRLKWIEFFTQHRKYGYTVILISQHKDLIDRQIRHLLEFDYEHRNVKNFKAIGLFLGLILGNFFVIPVSWMSNGKHDHTEFMVAPKKYYKLYDSYKIFNPLSIK